MEALQTDGLAWAAGLFEGEGSIAIARYSRKIVSGRSYGFQLICTLRMTDEQAVATFYEVLERGNMIRVERRLGWRPVWGWEASGRVASSALQLMLPHFRTDRVRVKAELGIEFQLARRIGTPARDPVYKASQAVAHERMRILNLRGQAAIDRDNKNQ